MTRVRWDGRNARDRRAIARGLADAGTRGAIMPATASAPRLLAGDGIAAFHWDAADERPAQRACSGSSEVDSRHLVNNAASYAIPGSTRGFALVGVLKTTSINVHHDAAVIVGMRERNFRANRQLASINGRRQAGQ